jgi:hypothetical protein
MKAARIKGAPVGVESVTLEGLKDVYKDINLAGEKLGATSHFPASRRAGAQLFHLRPTRRPSRNLRGNRRCRISAECTFAQFVMLSPYPGTVDFNRREKTLGDNPPTVAGIPLTRRWLIPQALRPKSYWDHPVMSAEEIRSRTQDVWDNFYGWGPIWKRSSFIKSGRGPACVGPHLQNLPDDVCRNRHCYGQRPRHPVGTLGALAGQTLPASLRRQSDARAPGAWTATAGLRVAVASSIIVVSRDSARSPAFPQKNPPLTR